VSPDELLTELVEVLDEELERMATVRFRLVVLGSLMAADQTPWLERSIRDLEVASEQLRLSDLRRAVATVGLLDEYELEDDARLEDIAERADRAWGEMLRERRLRLLEEMAGVSRLVDTAAAAAGSRTALVQEALTFLRRDTMSDYRQRRSGTARLVQGSM
jgi:hypothetical protein